MCPVHGGIVSVLSLLPFGDWSLVLDGFFFWTRFCGCCCCFCRNFFYVFVIIHCFCCRQSTSVMICLFRGGLVAPCLFLSCCNVSRCFPSFSWPFGWLPFGSTFRASWMPNSSASCCVLFCCFSSLRSMSDWCCFSSSSAGWCAAFCSGFRLALVGFLVLLRLRFLRVYLSTSRWSFLVLLHGFYGVCSPCEWKSSSFVLFVGGLVSSSLICGIAPGWFGSPKVVSFLLLLLLQRRFVVALMVIALLGHCFPRFFLRLAIFFFISV